MALSELRISASNGDNTDLTLIPFVYSYTALLSYTPYGKGPLELHATAPPSCDIQAGQMIVEPGNVTHIPIMLLLKGLPQYSKTYTLHLSMYYPSNNVNVTSIVSDQFTINVSNGVFVINTTVDVLQVTNLVIHTEDANATVSYDVALNLPAVVEFTVTGKDSTTTQAYTFTMTYNLIA